MSALQQAPSPEAFAALAERLERVETSLAVKLDSLGIEIAVAEFHASRPNTPHERVRRVAAVVAEEWGTTWSDLIGPSRTAHLIRPRFVVAWLCKTAGHWSYPEIGRLLGNRDHTTAMHACRRVDGWRDRDAGFRLVTDQLLDMARIILCAPQKMPADALAEPDAQP